MDKNNLTHAGIKGMKWGRRRWQNKDGSLTPEGKLRYGNDAETSEDYIKTHSRKHISQLSNKELDERINRKIKEKQLKALEKSSVRKAAEEAALNAGKNLLQDGMTKGVKGLLNVGLKRLGSKYQNIGEFTNDAGWTSIKFEAKKIIDEAMPKMEKPKKEQPKQEPKKEQPKQESKKGKSNKSSRPHKSIHITEDEFKRRPDDSGSTSSKKTKTWRDISDDVTWYDDTPSSASTKSAASSGKRHISGLLGTSSSNSSNQSSAGITESQARRIKTMSGSSKYTSAEIARIVGVSTSTVNKYGGGSNNTNSSGMTRDQSIIASTVKKNAELGRNFISGLLPASKKKDD